MGTNLDAIQRVLAGEASYDTLNDHDQALVRAAWDEQMAERREALDLTGEFRRAGRSWIEADDQGRAIRRS